MRWWPSRKAGTTGVAVCLLFLFSMLAVPGVVGASEAGMKGPRLRSQPPPQEEATGCVEVAFLQVIRLYQKRLSPIGGPDRCGFRPSCSAYGYLAIKEQGPLVGLLMTADRLTRCNLWKKPGADYLLLPLGKLYDPPSLNLLSEP